MSTKKKAGPKWTFEMAPTSIKKPGTYELRNEKIVNLSRDAEGYWVDDAGHGHWKNNGYHCVRADLDVMAFINPIKEPKPEPPKPVITGPGEYIMECGDKAVVEYRSNMPGDNKPWSGYVVGKGRRENSYSYHSWDDNGISFSCAPSAKIIGPWVEKKKFLVPCINVNDGQFEVVCLSATDAEEASKWVADNHPEYCVGNAMTADEMTKYIAAAIRPAIEGVEK